MKDITKMNLKQQFFHYFQEEMAPYGFFGSWRKEAFFKKNPDGFFEYALIFRYRYDEWSIEPILTIRKHLVQEILHKFCDVIAKGGHKTSPTISIHPGLDFDKEHITDTKEIPTLVQFYKKLFLDVALPFFEKNHTLQKMNTLINVEALQQPQQLLPFEYGGLYMGGMVGLIIAKLLNVAEYAELETKYLAHYTKISRSFLLQFFNPLRKSLSNPSFESFVKPLIKKYGIT
jgi:hypothetical protein